MNKEKITEKVKKVKATEVPSILAFTSEGHKIYGQHQETGEIYWWSQTEREWLLYYAGDEV